MPVAVRDIGAAEDAQVDAVDFRMAAAAVAARFQALLKPVAGGLEGTEMKCRDPGEMIGLGKQRGIVDPAR